MTPLGHLSVAYLCGKSSEKLVMPALLLGGLLPDVDFLLLPFAFFNQVHRVLTHNLLFVSVAAFLIAAAWRTQEKRLVFFCILLGEALHLLADSCMDGNSSNGIGIALFRPFFGEFFSPINLIDPVEHSAGWAEPVALLRSSLGALTPELPFWGLAALLLLRKRLSRKNEEGVYDEH